MGEMRSHFNETIDTSFWWKVVRNISSVSPELLDLKVEDYVVGARYSAVKLVSGEIGIAYSYVMEDRCKPRSNYFKKVWDFVSLLSSECVVERSLGQAAINAIGQHALHKKPCRVTSVIDEITSSVHRNELIVFLGALKRIPDSFKAQGYNVYVLDRGQSGKEILPDFYAYKILPKARVVYVTGAAFSRPDIDLVFEISRNAKYLIEIGPSLTLSPQYLYGTGLTHLETSIINEPEEVFHSIKLGLGYHDIRENLEHVSCRV
jgi:uncharacterized protein (DUF4213/DUF364 family)